FTLAVSDGAGAAASKPLSIAIAAALTITTSSLPGATLGIAYSQTVASSGGTAPLAWSVTGGALPAGLSLNAATGAISGTPTTALTASFTLHVVDAATQSANQALSIAIAAALVITTNALPGSTAGVAYSQTATASGGTAPLSWSVTVGALPAGLNLNAGTGAITGTPTTAGTAGFTLRVTDNVGAAVSKALSIVIAAAPSVTTTSLPGGTAGA